MMKDFLKLPRDVAAVDEWFTTGRFAVLLGVILCGMFHEVLLGMGTFFYRDFGIYGYPLAHYAKESFWRGEMPLWNPLNNCGLPFLAQWNTMTLYPPALFYMVLPLSWALGVFCVLHLFLGGMGMYGLAHRWTGSRLGASLAGLAFAVNGLTWHSLMWPNNIAAFGWMPWVVWMVERAWAEGGRRRLIMAGVVGAMQMLSGAPEIVLLTWVFVAVLWLVEGARRESMGGWGGWRVAGRFGLVVMIVAGLSAAQLVPFLDLLAHSQRDTVYGGLDWSMPGLGWANFLVPLFQTFPSFHGVYAQHGQYWTTSYYVGVGVVALALWAACRVPDRRVRVLAGASAVCLVLALGEHGYLLGWLQSVVPQVGFMRFPVKFVALVIFAAPLLAAYAIGRYWAEGGKGLDRQTLLGTVIFLGIMIGVIVLCAYRYPLPNDDWAATWRNAAGRLGLLVVVVGLLLALPRVGSPRWKWACCLGLLLASWLDVRTHAKDLNPTVPRWVYEPGLVRAEAGFDAEPRHGESRARVTVESLQQMRHASVASPTDDYLGRRLSLYGNCNLLDGIPKLSGFYSLYLKEAEEILDPLRFTPDGERGALMEFLNVSQSIAPGTLMDWRGRDSYMPFITGGQKPVFADAATTEQVVREGRFVPRDLVFLPLEAGVEITATNRTKVTVLSRAVGAQRIDFELEAEGVSLVTIAQSYYHPWRAYVDGEPTRIWRGNHAFQALEVPGGRHRVEMVYEDWGFRVGVAVSVVTLLLCGGGWTRWGRGVRGSSGGELVVLSRSETEIVPESVVASLQA